MVLGFIQTIILIIPSPIGTTKVKLQKNHPLFITKQGAFLHWKLKESWALKRNKEQCIIHFGENSLSNCISMYVTNMANSKFMKKEKRLLDNYSFDIPVMFPFYCFSGWYGRMLSQSTNFYSYVDMRGKDRVWQTNDFLLQVLKCMQCSLSSWCDAMKWPPSSCSYSPFPIYIWRTEEAYLMVFFVPLPGRILFSSRLVISLNVLESLCSNHIYKYAGVWRK